MDGTSVVRVTVLSWLEVTGGHIQQLPSGSWRVKVYAGTDPLTGREIRLRKTCKTERAAQIELGKLLEQAAAGRQPETDATVAQLMDRYAEVADWDLSTRKANEVYIRRVIKSGSELVSGLLVAEDTFDDFGVLG